MIYGLYLSATGVLTNAYRQDVIANNMANSETIGFKKDLTQFKQRLTEAQETGKPGMSNPILENIGGGFLTTATQIDTSAGDYESTGNNLDVALEGSGYFGVSSNGQTRLTRNGEFMIDRDGTLVMSTNPQTAVLDDKEQPIHLESTGQVHVTSEGAISQDGNVVAHLGLFDVSDPTALKKEGGTLFSTKDGATLTTATPTVRSGFVERSNVDPAVELSSLMDAQRQLEANANMIHYQDETLDKLVNDVGKIA
jgi:flagellar basal-body rod protein FlgF